MFYRTIIFVCFVRFVLANENKRYTTTDQQTKIIFDLTSKKSTVTCDHHYHKDIKQVTKYTVLEKKKIIIITTSKHVNHLLCRDPSITDFNTENSKKNYGNDKIKISHIIQAEKRMGTLWNCTILSNRDVDPGIAPVVVYDDHKYTASYCYMKIHVRLEKPPQTILVNNMVLPAVRTDLADKDVDFTAEYQYADGDVVDVICANLNTTAPLTMEYAVADKLSDKFNSTHLSSHKGIGFVATLRSEHNNTYMICTYKESDDYTKVKVIFVMRTEFNVVSITINKMTMRPILSFADNMKYNIEYKYLYNQDFDVVCEVNRTDMKLMLTGYLADKAEKPTPQKAVMSFCLQSTDDKKLSCSSDYAQGSGKTGSVEIVSMHFTAAVNLFEVCNLHMNMSSNGTVMELYNHNKLKVIFYEFVEDDTLELKCFTLLNSFGPVLYVQFNDPVSDKSKRGNSTAKSLKLSSKSKFSEISCYLKEVSGEVGKEDEVRSEIRVIFREKVFVPTPSADSAPLQNIDEHLSGAPSAGPTSGDYKADMLQLVMILVAGVVVCIIVIVCISIVIIKLRMRNHLQGEPQRSNYENLQTQSETTIPPYPPQWESNYAVPVDRRAEDTTYSVPCQEPALYSVPIPKNQRNKKQKAVDPTYAILDQPSVQGKKNVFKETDDPNYSEVYATRKEQCYAKVLPKSVRNKMAKDQNPYSEPSYVNTEPEPMYCEPSTAVRAQGAKYANIKDTLYANTNAPEYVEPTYSELQK